MTPFENAYEEVSKLVRKFDEHKDQFMAHNYQEAHVRTEFLDGFWTALGWDVRHRDQTNPREQEVKIEKSDTAGSTRRVDYAFRLKPDYKNTVFFCEAKKPSVDLANPDDYFQLVRYGYGAGTPVGVLTNFDEFHVIDCRYQPHIEKSYPSAQIKVFGYKDYLDKESFGFIYWLFSREAVAAAELKKYAAGLPKQRGTGKTKLTAEEAKPVDEAFLSKLEEYRLTLAKAFKKADETLTSEVLTEATQKVIDRLVFIRFLEDKYIESDYIVDQIAARKNGAWKSFIGWSKELDVKYNGVVFKPHDIDKNTFKAPDDKVFSELCADISHSESKYLFTYIPIELLGSIYERFLGKVVITTAKQAKIEDKPEVRKAGGVYYTPKYIVDYIVANTVGELLEGKMPKEISALHFADIACGSGSFLIGVYDAILHYVEKYYNDNPQEAKKAKCTEIDKGAYALSLKQKQQILLDNIFGVDIDRQAVEVAQLSLFLKLLESESGATAEQVSFERTKILPDLSKNIQCGNSLVEYDISDLFPLTDEEEKHIKPFSFRSAFREIMTNGGFDVIVGNPPWGAEYGPAVRTYMVHRFETVPSKTKDSYMYFIASSILLLKPAASLGFITPNTWLLINNAGDFRKWLLRYDIAEISDYGDGVFQEATVESSIIILRNSIEDGSTIAKRFKKGELISTYKIRKQAWLNDPDARIIVDLNEDLSNLISKLKNSGEPFENKCIIKWGIKPYQVGYGEPPQTKAILESRAFHSSTLKGPEWKPLVVGSDVDRYRVEFSGKQYIKYGKWLMYTSSEELITKPKILLRQTSDTLRAGYDDKSYYPQNSVFIISSDAYDLKYLIGLLNSRLLGLFYRTFNPQSGKVFAEIKPSIVKQLPIKIIKESTDKELHDSIVKLVDQMLDTKKRLASAMTETDRERHQKKCEYLDGEIDRLVYELYGLTAEEIKIVEGAA